MNTSPELMYAILAMDAYNRGYNPGIESLGGLLSQIGTASLKSDSETRPETQQDGQAAGFYAVEYEWNGETIISYRGTDQNFVWPFSDSGSDLWNGYGTGVGSSSTEQSRLAAEFYQAVTGTQSSNPVMTGDSATLTGHSLGGGLAGLIGALYYEDAVLFDNMPFELAAEALEDRANVSDSVGADLKNDFYNGEDPWAPLLDTNLQGHAVSGEFLEAFRLLQDTP